MGYTEFGDDVAPLEPAATRSSDPWYQVGEEIRLRWGHGLTCGAANEILAQARRFGKEQDVPTIVGTIASPGVWVVKCSHKTNAERPATVELVTSAGLVRLMRNNSGRAERFTWALSNMVYWYLSGQLSHSKGTFATDTPPEPAHTSALAPPPPADPQRTSR